MVVFVGFGLSFPRFDVVFGGMYRKAPVLKGAGVLAVGAVLAALALPAFAFDMPKVADAGGADPQVMQTFREGLNAYYGGNSAQAVKLLSTAADAGMVEAQWKLGRIYAEGDGVKANEARAFDYFSRVLNVHGDEERSSDLAPYVANSYTELGNYFLHGIRATRMKPDPDRAMRFLYIAANTYGDPEAQYRLGLMYRDGEGVAQDQRRAAYWLQSAAKKGQVGAQAAFGGLLVEGSTVLPANPVRGLMWLTIAARRVAPGSAAEADIQDQQERAFAELEDQDRVRAVSLANRWLSDHPQPGQADAPVIAAAPHPPTEDTLAGRIVHGAENLGHQMIVRGSGPPPVPPRDIPVPPAVVVNSSAPGAGIGVLPATAEPTLPGAALGLQPQQSFPAIDAGTGLDDATVARPK